jgi:hypothetical protein
MSHTNFFFFSPLVIFLPSIFSFSHFSSCLFPLAFQQDDQNADLLCPSKKKKAGGYLNSLDESKREDEEEYGGEGQKENEIIIIKTKIK